MKTSRVVAVTLALLLAVSSVPAAEVLPCAVVRGPGMADRLSTERPSAKIRLGGERFVRTELFFGLAKPDGEVTRAEFKRFLDQCVDGLMVVAGRGQFRGADDVLIKERSRLLILLYPADRRRVMSARIEEISDAYKQLFQQESVLRADRCCERVTF